MSAFKAKQLPKPEKGPAPIRSTQGDKSDVPISGGRSGEDLINAAAPDGPRAGYSVLPSGKRAYKDEKPYPPATAPAKPFKVK